MRSTLFNIHDVVLLITIYQCLFFALFLLLKDKKYWLSHALLASFFLANAAIPLDILINFGAEFRPWAIENTPNLFYVFDIGYWVQGPLLLWYLRSLSSQKFKLGWTDTLLITPYLLFALHQLIAYHTLATDAKIEQQQAYSLGAESISIYFLNFSREVLRVIFAVLCVIELKRHTSQLKKNTENASTTIGLKLLTFGTLGIWVWALIIAVAIIISTQTRLEINFEVMGLMANYLTCFLLSAVIITMSRNTHQYLSAKATTYKQGANRQGINPEHIANLELAMDVKQAYLDPSLTLEHLAGELKISPRTLSSVINGYYHCNFFEFINKYRIEAAKKRLSQNDGNSSSVLEIMYEVGFSSKATFNTAFKKSVGMTPSQYKKSQREKVLSLTATES